MRHVPSMPGQPAATPESPLVPRRGYARPALCVIGALRDITQAVGSMSNLDGGTMLGSRRSQ
ncbi:MAG TPA: hypothetical protein VG916_11635 [Gemmatimonadaceae bacterium]|nr:hypothetical protein [Gemmatimonadaceae bacterium]